MVSLRLAVRNAEKAIEHLLGGDGIAVPGQGFRMGAAGNHFAVDQHAVAVENDEIEGSRVRRSAQAAQDLSSSSGTQ